MKYKKEKMCKYKKKKKNQAWCKLILLGSAFKN